MFEIPRRGRQARNFECSENSRSQIVFQIDIFRKLALDAPGCVECWIKQWFYQKRAVFHLISKHSLNINFLCISFMNYWWVWEVWSRCEWTVRLFFVRNGIPSNGEINMPRRFLHVVWVQTFLYLFLPLVYLISSENNSIFNSKKPFSDKLLYFNRIWLFAFDYFYRKCKI